MAQVPLYPYQRLHPKDVDWSAATILLDGAPVDRDELADRWDGDSTIRISVGAVVKPELLRSPAFPEAQLVVQVSCRDTSVTRTARAAFGAVGDLLCASAAVEFSGTEIAQLLEVRALLQAPFGHAAWLSRRIIAERRPEKMSLDSVLTGFPTTALSFSENHLPEAPWRISVSAASLSDPFIHSVKLMLNVDYPRVNELIDGEAQPHVEAALKASIIRVILHSARRLADLESADDAVETAVAEYPESFAAAADKTCRGELRRSLTSVLSLVRTRPEEAEDLIAEAVDLLKGK